MASLWTTTNINVTYITNYHVEFNKRQANEIAHELDKADTSSHSFHIYDDVPTCINDLIANEML